MAIIAKCVSHPDVEASFFCSRCVTERCRECVEEIHAGGAQSFKCRSCSALALPISERHRTQNEMQPGFWPYVERIPDFFLFAIRPRTLWFIFWATVFIVGVSYIRLPILSFFLVLSIEAYLLYRFISDTVFGKESSDETEFNPLHTVIWPIACFLAAGAPVIAGAFWYLESCTVGCSLDLGGDAPGPTILIYFGVAIFPLTSLIAACTRQVVATLNPLSWFRLLGIVQLTYVPAALFFYGVNYANVHWLQPEVVSWSTASDSFAMSFLCLFLLNLPVAVQGRALGSLALPHMGRFDTEKDEDSQ